MIRLEVRGPKEFQEYPGKDGAKPYKRYFQRARVELGEEVRVVEVPISEDQKEYPKGMYVVAPVSVTVGKYHRFEFSRYTVLVPMLKEWEHIYNAIVAASAV